MIAGLLRGNAWQAAQDLDRGTGADACAVTVPLAVPEFVDVLPSGRAVFPSHRKHNKRVVGLSLKFCPPVFGESTEGDVAPVDVRSSPKSVASTF